MSTDDASWPKILIVEDEVIVAMEIQDILEASGYRVAGIAATGEDAIRKAADAAPNLILMDITLRGGMTGIEAAGKILDGRSVPILFLTAAADQAGILRIKERTICAFISKPFEERLFIEEIRNILSLPPR
jgi:two-component system, response regulator PdtaR